MNCRDAVEVPVEGNDLLDPGPLHQRRMVRVRERNIEVYVELEHPAIEPLIWQINPG